VLSSITKKGEIVNHLGPLVMLWRNKNAGLDHIEQKILETYKHWLWIK
jgi:hypothetical protein